MFNRRTLLKGGLAAAAIQSIPVRAQGTKVSAPFPIYDTHAHFYTNERDKYPFKPDIQESALSRAMTDPKTPEAVTSFWDDAGILMGTGVQYNTTYNTDNSYLLDVCAANPARFLPVVILSPTDAGTPDALRRMAKENGIVGVRFMGRPENGEYPFLSEAAVPVWQAVDELGIAMVLMPFGGELNHALGRIHEFATRFPGVNIVLDHLSFPDPTAYPDTFGLTPMHHALAAHRNIYYKITSYLTFLTLDATHTDLKGFLDYTRNLYGTDRMVWGSDFGNTEGDHFAYLQRAVDATAGWSYADRRAMFFDTAYRLFVPGGQLN